MRKLLVILLLCGCAGSRTLVPAAPSQVSLALRAHTLKLYKADEPTLGITSGPDGALWFTETDKIGRITTSGKLKYYSTLTNSARPFGIAVGPDKALWFTEGPAGKIGRITTSGHVSEYPVKPANYSPARITAGPDGALWFTEGSGNTMYIGRMTTSGKASAYLVMEPAGNSSTNGITAGPGKTLWFTIRDANMVGKITTKGHIKLFANTDGDSQPSGIASIGNSLWVGESAGVAHVSAHGKFTEYPLSPSGSVLAIATGPNAAPWYAVFGVGDIGTIANGKAVEYQAAPTGDGIFGIVEGKDKALWFTDYNENAIGRFTP